MKKINLLLLFVLLIYACGEPENQNTKLAEATPLSVGFSEDFEAQLDDFINSAMADTIIPHGTFLVAKDNKLVYYKSFGDQRPNDPLQNTDIYRLASMTKAVTSVAVMQLSERGVIDLDDPVYKYIPAFENQVVLDEVNMADTTFTTVPVEKPVTIRNLLTHTSGIVYGSFNPGKLMAVYEKYDMNVGFSHETWTTEEWINRLAEVPLAHQPGAKFSYGLSMDVLGRIIEVASKQKLDAYFKENIFEPAEMTDTYFYQPATNHERIVPVQMKVNGAYMSVNQLGMSAMIDYPKETGRDIFAGGAGLSGTTMDYANFIQDLVAGGNGLLSEATTTEMSSDQLPEVLDDIRFNPFQRNGSFALGFQLYQDKESKVSPKSPGTYEWGGFFNTKFFIDPEQQLIFVGMTQINSFQHNDFWDDMYQKIYDGLATE